VFFVVKPVGRFVVALAALFQLCINTRSSDKEVCPSIVRFIKVCRAIIGRKRIARSPQAILRNRCLDPTLRLRPLIVPFTPVM